MGIRVYVVVCHDRHSNDGISVHLTLDAANAEIESFKSLPYYASKTWVERDYGRGQGWLRYVEEDHGDGPNARIEETELDDSRLREILRAHWPTVICDHDAKTDRAQCSCCSYEPPTAPSVGAAIETWVEHVVATMGAV